jgi:hypothetical protein
MIRDRRQEILDRLFAILNGLTINLVGGPEGAVVIEAGNVVRNRNQLQADKVPGLILLDADEVRDPTKQLREQGLAQGRMPTQVMKMTPEIYVVLDVRGVQNENVGQDLNTARLAINAAIFGDAQLQTIIGTNGNAIYDGMVTDLARNRTMKGQCGLSFTFSYPLILTETVAG